MLAGMRGLSTLVVAALWGAAILTFLALAMATKIAVGEERLIWYHHEVAIIACAALLLRVAGLPVAPYLDILAIGLAVFLACGRIGCLLAGCCHGLPSTRGIRYGEVHVREGFPDYLAGVPLFPIQAVESVAVLTLAGAAVWLLLAGASAGSAFAVYVAGYAMLRFTLEFFRGDTARRYWRGFSEAQWTSLLLALFVPAVAGGIAVAMVLLYFALRRRPLHRLFRARHIRELARAIADSARPEGAAIVCTSGGLRISQGRTIGVHHYTLSCAPTPLDLSTAERLGGLIGRLAHSPASGRVVPGNTPSVYHLVLEEAHAHPR